MLMSPYRAKLSGTNAISQSSMSSSIYIRTPTRGALRYFQCKNTIPVHYIHPSSLTRGTVRVCVPGAGLGRLAFEIARLGFSAQGNEWSVHMLLASHVVLNG